MRLRRETGDFSINMEVGPGAAKYSKQLPKGLSAEDFIGAIVNMSMTVIPAGSDTPVTTTIIGVASAVQTTTANDDILLFGHSGAPIAVYSPTTGIIESYEENGGGNGGGNPSTNL
jgi:hypothetical protein